jgi:hypothetical protein
MEWLLKNVNYAPKGTCRKCRIPNLRVFTVKKATSYEPVPDIAGVNGWNVIPKPAVIHLR